MHYKSKPAKGWRDIVQLLHAAQSPAELDKLFQLFLTSEERDDLAARYLIVQELLKNEKTQREIAQDFHVSITKITRGSNGLKTIDPQLRAFLQKEINGV